MNKYDAARRKPVTLRLCCWVLATGLALGMSAGAADRNAGEYPRLSSSAFWQTYAYDGATLALFHLDEAAPATAQPDMEALTAGPAAPAEDPGLGGDTAPGADRAKGRRAPNAVPMASAAILLGDAAFVKEGRLNGAVHLGGNGALAINGLAADRTGARMLECWIKPEAWSAEPQVVMAASSAAKSYLWRLLLQGDGTLELEWAGKPTGWPAERLVKGQWTHLAFGITTEWPDGNAVHFYRDGLAAKPLAISRETAIAAANACEAVWFGGDRAGRHGITGGVDEVRVSRALRAYYPYDLTWPQPGRTVAAIQGQPFFRDPADLLFRAGFNKDLKPEHGAANTQSPEHIVTQADEELASDKVGLLFPPGVEGSAALMVGESSLAPVYKGEGNLLPARGSIAFWLQPLNWDNLTRDNPYDKLPATTFGLFQIDGEYMEGSYDRIFRRTGPLVEFNLVMNMAEGVADPVEFTPGRWTHIAMTWEGTAFTYYVNGQRRDPGGAWTLNLPIYPGHDPRNPPQPDWWLNAKPQAIRFGTRTYWEQLKQPAPRSAIDDFRIYRRPLAASEIANLARLYDPRTKPTPLPAVELAMTYNGVSGRVTADLTPLTASYASATEATVRVLKEGATAPVGTATLKLDERKQGHLEVKTPPLEFATYRVEAEIRDAAGQSLGRAEQSFTRTPPPWWQNRAGISEKVMPDWTALRVVDNVIHVAEREITLGASGFPERIVALGEEVLAGPVTLEAANAGKPLALTAPAAKADVKAAGEVRADARGSLSGGGLEVGVASYTEFDGMMWFTVTLSGKGEAGSDKQPAEPIAIDQLTIRVPLRPDSAELIHWWSGERNFRDPKVVHIGALPPTPGVLFRSNDANVLTKVPTMRGSFIPYLLLTGDRHGLAWFAENDKGWTQSDSTPAVSVERSEKAVTLVLRMVTAPITLDGPRSFAFGLQPTPVKARDKLWRQYPGYSNIYPDTFCANNLKGRDGPTTFSLYPEDDWTAVKNRINGVGLGKGAAGLKGLYLGQLAKLTKAGVTNPPPQSLTVPGLYWDMQWNNIPATLTHTREWTESWALDYQYYTPEFVDFCSWAWNDWIGKTDKFVQGGYIDDCWGAPSTKPGGPTTYALPDGQIQPGFQFLGPRERFKRMRQISWDHGVWPHITAHTTHTFFVPYHAFFDLVLDGEDFYSAPPAQADFIDHWPLDRMRFMHNAKWGLVTTWLGWCGNSCPTAKFPAWTFRQTRAYVANMALHDIGWGFEPAVMDAFGLRQPDTESIPYWNNRGLVKENKQPDAIKVGAWKRHGKYLILVVNVGNERTEASLKLDLPATAPIRDVDPTLLTYFADDTTTVQKPEFSEQSGTTREMLDDKPAGGKEFNLEVQDSELPVAERQAKDPDGKFAWQNGVLTCPVRRHDFRLFIFQAGHSEQPAEKQR